MSQTPAQPDASQRPKSRRAGPETARHGPRSGGGTHDVGRTGDRGQGATSALCEIDYVDEPRVALARASLPPAGRVAALADLLRALGDPTRLTIVTALAVEGVEELCVCDLAELVGVSDSAMSHSLRSLRQMRVVRYRKVGKIAYYRLDDAHLARLVTEGLQHIEGE